MPKNCLHCDRITNSTDPRDISPDNLFAQPVQKLISTN